MAVICRTLCLWLFLLLALASGGAAAQTLQITAGDLSLVSSQRVGRTLFEYTYRLAITNTGPAAENVTATVTSNAAASVIVEGTLSFGDISAGGNAISTDTFTLRQDRRVPFNPAALDFAFTGDVVAGNTPPTAHAGPDRSVLIGGSVQLDGSASTDADGDTLTFTWSFVSRPAGSAATLSDPAGIRPTFQIDQPGRYEILLIVNDGQADSVPDTVEISTANSPPVAEAGPPQSVRVGDLVQLDGSASSDPDNDPLNFLWSLISTPDGSAAALDNPFIPNPGFVADRPGSYTGQLIVNDGNLDSAPDTVVITTENSRPVADAGQDQSVFVDETVQLDGSGSADADGDELTYRWALTGRPQDSQAALSDPEIVNPAFTPDVAGLYVAQLIVNDGNLDSEPDTVTATAEIIVEPNRPPQLTSVPVTTATEGEPYRYDTEATDPDAGDILTYSLDTAPAGMTVNAATGLIEWTPAAAQVGEHEVTVRVEDEGKLLDIQSFTITVEDDPLPPDPQEVAPPLATGGATTLSAATAFLYSGDDPIQTGMAPETIQVQRAAVIRGQVLNRSGQPLSGVTITLLNHPEYGQTLSRADGMFDLAVNGGGYLTVNYERDGFLPVQRQIQVPWQDFALVDDVVMTPLDDQVTVIDLDSTAPIQVARGSVSNDSDGTRQATVLFAQGTEAEMVMPDGSTQALSTLSVRATEYTVGPNGPQAMPGELPPTSAYTYAVELSVDEAMAAGAVQVRFSQPVPLYVENFLDFPVGTIVPVGYYDRRQGAWIPSPNGRVIEVLDISGGLASIDSDGDGAADNLLGLSEAERARLAGLYSPGQSLWRSPIDHFTPWDCNWPWTLPEDAEEPEEEPEDDSKIDDPDCGFGSIIECQNQILRETVGLTGVPFTLNYASDRTEGWKSANTIRIPLSGPSVPDSLERIELEIETGGRRIVETFPAQPNQAYTLIGDGQDAYGRAWQGGQPVFIRIGYVYGGVYAEPAEFERSFATFSGIPLTTNRTRRELTLWQEQRITIGTIHRQDAVAGWSFDAHHLYDPTRRILYRGDGSRRSAEGSHFDELAYVSGEGRDTGDGIDAAQANLRRPYGVDIAPDGSIYIADLHRDRVRKIDPNGIITTIAGGGNCSLAPCGDGNPATAAFVPYPIDVAIAPDGSFYILEQFTHGIRRVGPDGVISTLPVLIEDATTIDVGPDGSLYVLQNQFGGGVYRIGPDGEALIVAGNGSTGPLGDGGPATQAGFYYPTDVAVGPDGRFYIVDENRHRIRQVTPDGIITTVAGNGTAGFGGDGGLATLAALNAPSRIAVGPDGTLYIGDDGNQRIRKVSPGGIITTVAGNGNRTLNLEEGPATGTPLHLRDTRGIAVGPDNRLIFARLSSGGTLWQVQPILGSDLSETFIASEDGALLYQFTGDGRHVATLDTLTGVTLLSFSYDADGRLETVTDADGNVTTVERDGSGEPLAIIAPFGQRTALDLNANDDLAAITNPAGETFQIGYTPNGLLTRFANPRGNASTYDYDEQGRLVSAQDAAGGTQTLNRSEQGDDFTVTRTAALGRTTRYEVENLDTGAQRRINTLPDGTQTETLISTDGTRTTTLPDGTVIDLREGPDSRFGMQAPIPEYLSVTTGGLTAELSAETEAVLADPQDPLSLQTLSETYRINGRSASSVYTAATRTTVTTSPAGRTTTIVTDELGRPVQIQVPGIEPVTLTYDARGRLERSAQGSRVAAYRYNSDGYVETATDALNRTVTYSYDPAGRIIQQVLPGSRQIGYGYDTNSNLTALTPPGRPAHEFTYTAVDLEDSYIPPDVPGNGETAYAYNVAQELERVTRPDGKILDLVYDDSGRLQTLTIPRGQYGLEYNDASQLRRLSDPDGGALEYSYSGALLTGISRSGSIPGTVGFGYDNDFRVNTITLNGTEVAAYGYDPDSLLTEAGLLALSYDPNNGLLTGTTLSGLSDSYSYNSFGEVAAYSASQGGTALYDVQYTYDALGRITAKTETLAGSSTTYGYGYDVAGRLETVSENGTENARYTYDANGNRLSRTAGGSTVTGTYDDQDRLLQYGNAAYTYTANGELLTRTEAGQTTRYTYDVLGNLLGVSLSDSTEITYLIDGQGRRIGKAINGTLVQGFLYQDQLNPIAELDGNGNVRSRFVYGSRINVPDYMIRDEKTYRFITDQLGSPRLLVNTATGEIAQRLDYDEFGRVLQDTNPGFQPFGFAGGIHDKNTGLVRYGVRDYDPGQGRWTVIDPIFFAGGETNLYSYLSNDPINHTDSTGYTSDDLSNDKNSNKMQKTSDKVSENNQFDIFYVFSKFLDYCLSSITKTRPYFGSGSEAVSVLTENPKETKNGIINIYKDAKQKNCFEDNSNTLDRKEGRNLEACLFGS